MDRSMVFSKANVLAEWERTNLADQDSYGLVVVLNKFAEPDAPPDVAKPVPDCSLCLHGDVPA